LAAAICARRSGSRATAARSRADPAPSLFDQDTAHRLGGGREEVAAAVPLLVPASTDQPDVGLVDQCGGLKGLARLLLGHLLGCQLPQLVIDERQ
jgi:hypothetical protein